MCSVGMVVGITVAWVMKAQILKLYCIEKQVPIPQQTGRNIITTTIVQWFISLPSVLPVHVQRLSKLKTDSSHNSYFCHLDYYTNCLYIITIAT